MQAIVSFAGVTSSALAFQPSCMIACWAGLSVCGPLLWAVLSGEPRLRERMVSTLY